MGQGAPLETAVTGRYNDRLKALAREGYQETAKFDPKQRTKTVQETAFWILDRPKTKCDGSLACLKPLEVKASRSGSLAILLSKLGTSGTQSFAILNALSCPTLINNANAWHFPIGRTLPSFRSLQWPFSKWHEELPLIQTWQWRIILLFTGHKRV